MKRTVNCIKYVNVNIRIKISTQNSPFEIISERHAVDLFVGRCLGNCE